MDAVYLIAGFLGLLLFGQAFRRRSDQPFFSWEALAVFGLLMTGDSWLRLWHSLYPEYQAPAWVGWGMRVGAFSALILASVGGAFRGMFWKWNRIPLQVLVWIALLGGALLWGWVDQPWNGLEVGVRHGLVLPAGTLAALLFFNEGRRRQGVVALALWTAALGWLVMGLAGGLFIESTVWQAIGVRMPSVEGDFQQIVAAVSLGLVWLGLWAENLWDCQKSAPRSVLVQWLQPLAIVLVCLLGVFAIRWQESFYRETFRSELLLQAHGLAATVAQGGWELGRTEGEDVDESFCAGLQGHFRVLERYLEGRTIYTLKERSGKISFGRELSSLGSRSPDPDARAFRITPEDNEVFRSGRAKVLGPDFAVGGRYLTALAPVKDSKSQVTKLVIGVDVAPELWEATAREARRLPMAGAWVLGLLAMAGLTVRGQMVKRWLPPWLPVEGLLVLVFGLVFTWFLALLVLDRDQKSGRNLRLEQSVAMAGFISREVALVGNDLRALKLFLGDGANPVRLFSSNVNRLVRGRFSDKIALLEKTAKGWTVVGSVAENGAMIVERLGSLSPETLEKMGGDVVALEVPPGESGVVLVLALPQNRLLALSFEPGVLLQAAVEQMGPRRGDMSCELLDLTQPPVRPLASSVTGGKGVWSDVAISPVFCADQTWLLRMSRYAPGWGWQDRAIWLPPLISGLFLTGLALLFVLLLKRRQSDLEEEVHVRTAELRAREQESRELYERLHKISAQVPGIVFQFLLDGNGKSSFPYVSDAVIEITGRPTEELRESAGPLMDRIHPEDRPGFQESIETSSKTLDPWRREYRMIDPAGKLRWFEAGAIPQKREDGSTLWHGFAYDISDRKKTEQELAYRANFQGLMTEMATRFIRVSADHMDEAFHHMLERVGQLVEADRAYIFQFNLNRRVAVNTHEWCGPGITSAIDGLKDVPFAIMPEMVGSLLEGRMFTIQRVEDLPPGPLFEMLRGQDIKTLLLVPLMEGDESFGFVGFDAVRKYRTWTGREIDLLQVTASLITHALVRRKDEATLRSSEAQLRRNWEFTRTLLNAIPTPVYYMDSEGRFTGCNRSYLDFTGRTIEEFAGKTVFDLFEPREAEEQRARDLALLRSGERESYEGVARDMLGRSREVIYNRDVFRNEVGKIVGIVGSFIDISRIRKAEQDQREMERQLLHTQKLESLGVLAGGVAHDFNNILMAITGNLELARVDLPDDSLPRQAVDDAFLATKRAVDLTRQMLAYSGKGHFVIQPVDLNRVISDNLAILKAAISKNVVFAHDLQAELPQVRGDIGQIQQVIMNLITNASEAIGQKAGVVRLKTGVQYLGAAELSQCVGGVVPQPGWFVCVDVSDSGVGMNEETRTRMFEPFYSTKFTGRGLGMAAVMGILRGHRGGIFVESKVGEGTRIRIILPQIEEQLTEAVGVKSAAPAGKSLLLRGHVLVGDDEEDVRNICQKMLEHLGFKVTAVNDGVEIVGAIEAHPTRFDVVLLDLTMPNMDGAATLSYLKKHYPKLPVILISGYSREEALNQFQHGDWSGFVQKPFDLESLRREMAAALKRA